MGPGWWDPVHPEYTGWFFEVAALEVGRGVAKVAKEQGIDEDKWRSSRRQPVGLQLNKRKLKPVE